MRHRPPKIAIVFACGLVSLGAGGESSQPAPCWEGSPIPDPLEPRCLKHHLTLACVTEIPEPYYGYVPIPDSSCGVRRCWQIWFCPCGPASGWPCELDLP